MERAIGWENLSQFSEDYLIRVSKTVNENDLTEKAAIAVMALLIHELEGVTIQEVLPIGSGGDYAIRLGTGGPPFQVEVSGIRIDPQGWESSSRLTKKLGQVLSVCACGYASVTTFSWRGGNSAHSYLHYTEIESQPEQGRRKGKPKKGKKL